MNAITTIAESLADEAGPRIKSGVTVEVENASIFSARAKGAFLEHLSLNGNVRLACRAARVSPQTAYRARRAQTQFAALWDAALLSARTHAEEVLADRAMNGWEEAVFYHGEEVATRRRYSDRLLLAHLARLDRLAGREEVSAALHQLDDAIDALARGEEIPPLRQARDGRNLSDKNPVPCVPSGSSPTPAGGGNGENGGYHAADNRIGPDDPMWLGNRLDRMEAARPQGARLPFQFGGGDPHGDIEARQLEAFEAGIERWWLIVPPGPGDDPDGWQYEEDLAGEWAGR